MAQLVEGGSSTFDALVYGYNVHPGTQQFLQSQVERPTDTLLEGSREFVNKAAELYDRFSGSTAMRMARAAKRAIGSLWQSDEIRPLTTIGEMQHAPLAMQRWIMANSWIRDQYHAQKIEGYAESYRDLWENDSGEDHYDWRRVMNGFVTESEEHGWTSTTYFEELLPDDYDLSLEEQVDIHDTWENVVAAIRRGREDPTSRWNAEL